MSILEKVIDGLRKLVPKVPPHYLSQCFQLLQLCSDRLPVNPVTEQQLIKLLSAVQEAVKASAASPRMDRSGRLFSVAADRFIRHYANLQHPDNVNISRLMNVAKGGDALMKLSAWEEAKDGPLQRQVEVAIRLQSATAIVVDLLLSTPKKSSLWAILWMLLHPANSGVHLTLKQNPYFYRGELATLEAQKPIPFHTELADLGKDRRSILILIDREHRIFVETPQGLKVYGNIWSTNSGVILKDASGELLTAAKVMDENKLLEVSSGTHGTTVKTWKEFVAAAVTNDTAEWRIKAVPISRRKHRIFVQTPQGPMVYSNIWILTSGQAVLKDIAGKLLTTAEVMNDNQPLVSSGSQDSGGWVTNVCTWKQFVMDAAGRDDTEWYALPLGRILGLSDRRILRLCERYACRPIDALDRAIGSQPTSSEKSRKYLRALTKICGLTGELPSSHILTEELSRLDDNPVAGGSFGEVWKGRYNDRLVAIKSLRISHVDQPEAVRKNFCKEVVLWKRLSHKNIVPLYGVSTELSTLCMVSEWMPQGHIREYVRKNPEVSRLPLLLDIARGLSHLHSSNVIHGDLKGDNILINDAGTARLCDFGLSSVTRALTAQTSTRGGRGTAGWMAPELFVVEDTDDATTLSTRASDIYAMSIVVIEVLTGKLPFNGRPSTVVMLKTIGGCRPDKPANASQLGISDELWEVVTMCWRQEPQERPEISFVLESFRRAAGIGYS